MPVKPFEPQFMKIGVLTAALQELTPREVRDTDPDKAIEDWVAFARELGADYIQLSAALHPDEVRRARPRPCSTPWPTPSTCASPSTRTGRSGRRRRSRPTSIGLSDIGYFDNMLHDDPRASGKKKHDFMKRVMDAAVLLGVDAVCGFVGRNQAHSMDQNLLDFEKSFVPLLKYAKERGLTYRVEQCPMPGWTTKDNWHNNIAYAPGTWIALHRICEQARRGRPVPDPLRSLPRDPDGTGHALALPVPEGRGLQLPDRWLPREGPGHRREGRVGLGLRRPDHGARRLEGAASPRATPPTRSTPGRSRPCSASTSCRARRSTIPWPISRTAPWTGSTTSSPRASCLKLDVPNTHLVVEHEYPKARIQDKARLAPILAGSIAFTRKIDEAAACMYALQHEVLAAQGIPVQGHGREAYRS